MAIIVDFSNNWKTWVNTEAGTLVPRGPKDTNGNDTWLPGIALPIVRRHRAKLGRIAILGADTTQKYRTFIVANTDGTINNLKLSREPNNGDIYIDKNNLSYSVIDIKNPHEFMFDLLCLQHRENPQLP